MFDEIKEKQFILQLFNLEYSDVQDVSCIRAGNNVIIDITLASDPVPCPVCGCDQPHIKNYVTKNITHSVLSDRRCTLRYHARRYVCPVCGKKLTMGVDHRILQLSDRDESSAAMPESGRPYESLMPLPEVISACVGFSTASKKVQGQYEALLEKMGAEFTILREVPPEDIRKAGGEVLTEGIRRLRAGEVVRKPGSDGEYGKIELF